MPGRCIQPAGDPRHCAPDRLPSFSLTRPYGPLRMGRTRMPSKPCKEIRMKLSAIAVATLTAVAAVPASAEISDRKVKFGIHNDQSGVYADFGGQWSFRAAKMAAEAFCRRSEGGSV